MIVALVTLSVLIGAGMGISGIGGFLIVPLMMVVAGETAPQAVFTALVANLGVTLLNGLLAMARRHVYHKVLALLVIGSAAGAFGGSWLLRTMSPMTARWTVAAFLVGLAVLSALPTESLTPRKRGRWPPLFAVALGAVAQSSAVLVGIGGPAITVPVLGRTIPAMDRVVATALLHGAVVSALGLLVTQQAGATVDGRMLLVAAVVLATSLVAAHFRAKLLARVNIRPFVSMLAIIGAVVLLLHG